ncbi:ferredoxin--NADP reductase [Marinicella sediminis]|uniref:ferredoxin--NADP(+) reductase n=1 Tax=Marinicella sediminis TaxID=1792834 RepID=A0ABV7J940_9GAMM|nr:ferredoxin--NADP reductase [Marinicella sediminis]
MNLPNQQVAPTTETNATEVRNAYPEVVTEVHHWNDKLFSFRTTRNDGLRFENGQFVMVGLVINGKPVMRAYSIASPNYAEHLEFFSIKLEHGRLTSHLQNLQPGDTVWISKKPTGTLLLHDVHQADNLFMLATGTGLAPFMSLIQDPEVYEKFKRVILVHGVRQNNDLAYKDFIEKELPEHEYLGEMIRDQLIYYPTVTREPALHAGRVTEIISSGQLTCDLGLPALNPQTDRAMLCGNPAMLKDSCALLDELGFNISPRIGYPGDYVIERAFVDNG